MKNKNKEKDAKKKKEKEFVVEQTQMAFSS